MFAVYTLFPLVCIATRPIDVENGGAILDLFSSNLQLGFLKRKRTSLCMKKAYPAKNRAEPADKKPTYNLRQFF